MHENENFEEDFDNEIPDGKIPEYNGNGDLIGYMDAEGNSYGPDEEVNSTATQTKPKENENTSDNRSYLKQLTEEYGLDWSEEITDEELADFTQEELKEQVKQSAYLKTMKERDPAAYIMKEVGEDKFKDVFEKYSESKAQNKQLLSLPPEELGKRNLYNHIIHKNISILDRDEKGAFTQESLDLVNKIFNKELNAIAKEYKVTEKQALENMGKQVREHIEKNDDLDVLLNEYKQQQKQFQSKNYEAYEKNIIPTLANKVSLKEELKNIGFSEFEVNDTLEKELKDYVTQKLSIRKDAKNSEAEVAFFHELQTNPNLLTRIMTLNYMLEKGVFEKANKVTKNTLLKKLIN